MEQFVDKPFEHVKREMVRPNLVVLAITSLTAYHCGFQKLGTAIPSLTRDFLQLGTEGSADHEQRVKWTAGTLYSGGGETVLLLHCCWSPSAQRNFIDAFDRSDIYYGDGSAP